MLEPLSIALSPSVHAPGIGAIIKLGHKEALFIPPGMPVACGAQRTAIPVHAFLEPDPRIFGEF